MTPQELAELDLAVANVEGHTIYADGACWHRQDGTMLPFYQPTRDGAEAMRLLEKYKLTLRPEWVAEYWEAGSLLIAKDGDAPAIAICRAVVALKEKS